MIITPIPTADRKRFQETGLPWFGDSFEKKKEKINLEVMVHEKTAEKTMAMLIFLTPICSDDPVHTLHSVFLKCTMQHFIVLQPIYLNESFCSAAETESQILEYEAYRLI